MMTSIVSGTVSLINGPALPVLAAVGGMVYFGVQYVRANRSISRNSHTIEERPARDACEALPERSYYVACAGSPAPHSCTKVTAVDIQAFNLRDTQGMPVDVTLYDCYVVNGDSMKYAGIRDKDFILVPKDFDINSLTVFPEILVIKCHEPEAGKPWYKVRRAWYRGRIDDDFEEVAAAIMRHPKFRTLASQPGYRDDRWMLDNLIGQRLDDYKRLYCNDGKECPDEYRDIVISTTFDTDNSTIHFSIHPVSLIAGVVEISYTVPHGRLQEMDEEG